VTTKSESAQRPKTLRKNCRCGGRLLSSMLYGFTCTKELEGEPVSLSHVCRTPIRLSFYLTPEKGSLDAPQPANCAAPRRDRGWNEASRCHTRARGSGAGAAAHHPVQEAPSEAMRFAGATGTLLRASAAVLLLSLASPPPLLCHLDSDVATPAASPHPRRLRPVAAGIPPSPT
jgi:hypothetical protein